MVFFDNSKFLDLPSPFLDVVSLFLKIPLLITSRVFLNIFFPYYSIKFGALEPPHCNFLWFGLVVVFLAFMTSVMKKMAPHEFLLPINHKKLKKLWKFGFFHLWPLFGLQKIFGLFSIFLAFRCLDCSKSFKFELFWSNFAIKTIFAENLAKWISVKWW